MAKQQTPNNAGLQRLKQDIKTGAFGRLYFFYGEENYLREHYLSVLRKKLTAGPMEEFNYRRLTPEMVSFTALTEAVEAMPMMADRTLVQVDDYDPLTQDADTMEQMMTLFEDLPESCCLVFNFDTVAFGRRESSEEKEKKEEKKDDRRTELRRALQKVIQTAGCQVEFAKQTSGELAEWVTRHFRAEGKTIAPELCQHLLLLTGGDMTVLHGEIRKIAAFSRSEAISRRDIDAVVVPVLTAVMFDITDAMAAGDYDKALETLRDILRSREEPIKILAGIGSHFRRLLMAKTVAAAGKGVDLMMELTGSKSDYYCRKLMSQAAHLEESFCRRAVELCFRTDMDMKRSVDDGERLLELLLLTLAREAKA